MKLLISIFSLLYCSIIFANECVEGNCIDGYGTYSFSTGELAGDKYIGENKNNKTDGLGTYYDNSGEKYVGEFEDDSIHG